MIEYPRSGGACPTSGGILPSPPVGLATSHFPKGLVMNDELEWEDRHPVLAVIGFGVMLLTAGVLWLLDRARKVRI